MFRAKKILLLHPGIMSDASREGKIEGKKGLAKDTSTEKDKEKTQAIQRKKQTRGLLAEACVLLCQQQHCNGARGAPWVSRQRDLSVPKLCHSVPGQLGVSRSLSGASVSSG